LGFEVFTVLSLTMFSIKLLFLGDPVIRDIYTQRRIFAPPPPWPACVDLNKAAIQKER
jgi:hypothetical protein